MEPYPEDFTPYRRQLPDVVDPAVAPTFDDAVAYRDYLAEWLQAADRATRPAEPAPKEPGFWVTDPREWDRYARQVKAWRERNGVPDPFIADLERMGRRQTYGRGEWLLGRYREALGAEAAAREAHTEQKTAAARKALKTATAEREQHETAARAWWAEVEGDLQGRAAAAAAARKTASAAPTPQPIGAPSWH
jgi:hypothetical protein